MATAVSPHSAGEPCEIPAQEERNCRLPDTPGTSAYQEPDPRSQSKATDLLTDVQPREHGRASTSDALSPDAFDSEVPLESTEPEFKHGMTKSQTVNWLVEQDGITQSEAARRLSASDAAVRIQNVFRSSRVVRSDAPRKPTFGVAGSMVARRASLASIINDEMLQSLGVVSAGDEDEELDPIDMANAIDDVVAKLVCHSRFDDENSTGPLDPSWCQSLFSWRGRGTLGNVYAFMVIWSVAVVAFQKLYITDVMDVDEEPWTDLKSIPLLLVSAGLMFLVVFRTQTSYKKWSGARQAWVLITAACRSLSMQSLLYFRDLDASSSLCRYLVVFVLSVRFWLREEPLNEELVQPILTPKAIEHLLSHGAHSELAQKIDGDKRLSFHFKEATAPLPVLEVMRTILHQVFQKQGIGPFHSMMEMNFKTLMQALVKMETVLDTQIPYAYITHVRTAITLYSLSIPFLLVNECGWFTILFVVFYCYVVFGLENLAVEIEDPFGLDHNDLPMDAYCGRIAQDISNTLRRREKVIAEVGDPYLHSEVHEPDEDDEDCDDDGGDD